MTPEMHMHLKKAFSIPFLCYQFCVYVLRLLLEKFNLSSLNSAAFVSYVPTNMYKMFGPLCMYTI